MISFALPAAFWGLGTLAILALLAYWRQQAPEIDVPSLRLWKAIPERLPPIERRRALRSSKVMWLQMAAAAMLVAALAAPWLEQAGPPPRRLVLGIDTSIRMPVARAREAASALIAQLHSDDVVEIHTTERFEHAGPTAMARLGKLALLSDRGEPIGPLMARIASVRGVGDEEVRRFLITDRKVETPPGVECVVVNRAAPNAGIVEVSESDGTLAVTVRAKGVPSVTLGSFTEHFEGEKTFFVPVTSDIEIVAPGDGFAADNQVWIRRTGEGSIRVSLEGNRKKALEEVLKADPRVVFGTGGVRIRVGKVIDVFRGEAAEPEVGEPSTPGPLTPAEHAVLDEVKASEMGTPAARSVAPGEWLLKDGERVVCTFGPGRVICGLEVDGSEWSRQLSFPIFWHNVLSHVAGTEGQGAWEFTGLLDREQSTIPEDPPTPPPLLDSGQSLRKLRLDVFAWGLAIALMLAAWVAECTGR